MVIETAALRNPELLDPIDVTRDVTACGEVISKQTAYNAGRTALRYVRDASKLPFAQQFETYSSGGEIVEVTLFPGPDDEHSLFGTPSELSRSKSFMQAAKALCRFAGKQPDQLKHVNIMAMPAFDAIPLHRDKSPWTRSVLQLWGQRALEFVLTARGVMAFTDMHLFEGDAYKMQFRDNDESILHGIDYWPSDHEQGAGINVAMYIDTYDKP